MSGRRVTRAVGLAGACLLALGGCAASRELAAARQELRASPAGRLLARRCDGCHDLPAPYRMTRAHWLRALDRMQRRVRLPAAEWDTLATLAALAAADSMGGGERTGGETR